MSTNRWLILLALLAIVILGVLGLTVALAFGIFAPFRSDTSTPIATPVVIITEVPPTPMPATPMPPTPTPTPEVDETAPGVVAGAVCFPSEMVPAMTLYFEETREGELVTVAIAENQTSFSVELPAGTYRAYAWLPDFQFGGSYSQMVPCGLQASCTDHSLILVEVSPGQTTAGVDICDWYGQPGDVPLPPGVTPPAPTGQPTQLPTQPTATAPVTPLVPSPTPVAGAGSACDRAEFVADVTLPEGAKVEPGRQFTKTWRIKNAGTCTWTRDYDLVFAQGNRMSGPNAVALPQSVKPGQTIDLSVTLTSPTALGEYSGGWQLRNASGQTFGTGTQGTQLLWVRIEVAEFKVVFNFADNYCDAIWRNTENFLDCLEQEPGQGDPAYDQGYAVRLEGTTLEIGRQEDETILLTRPQGVVGGLINGRFPAMRVRAGDRFRAVIGCLDGASGCEVLFRLSYRIGGGNVVRLGQWTETYDGKITRLDVDLTPLAGESVQFILSVRTIENPQAARAFWLEPRIVR